MADRVAIITGAASGIGRATAHRLAEAGTAVALLDRDEQGLREATPPGGLALPTDVADRGAVERAVEATVERFGRIDALVTCAAIMEVSGPPADVERSGWDTILQTNLFGVVNACQAVIGRMTRGAIVNTASVTGTLRALPARSPYNAAKGALVSFTRDLAAAYGPQGIRANVLVPGFIDTPMSRRLVAGHEDRAAAEAQRIPLRRIGDADEVARAARFLAGDEASYVNGSVLVVDGGLSVV